VKVDIVVAFYEDAHQHWWDYLKWGFEQNKEYINRVIVVNDGYWKTHPIESDPMYTFRDHKREGFGLSKSLNQGIAIAKTDFVLIMEGDEILLPGSLAKTLPLAVEGGLLCCGKVYYEPSDLNALIAGEKIKPIETDHRWNMQATRHWKYASGGHLLIHRESDVGFNEAYGYGLHDFDYAARWKGSFRYTPDAGFIGHIGSGKGRNYPDEQAFIRFSKTLGVIHNNNYNLACGQKFDVEAVNVDLDWTSAADVVLDCTYLNWIKSGTAKKISHGHFIEHMSPYMALEHLEAVYCSLAPGGDLVIECPDMNKLCKAYLEGNKEKALQGFFSDPVKQTKDGWQHHTGWDVDTLSEVLVSIGFEINYAGDSFSETCAWRDLRIEASKPE